VPPATSALFLAVSAVRKTDAVGLLMSSFVLDTTGLHDGLKAKHWLDPKAAKMKVAVESFILISKCDDQIRGSSSDVDDLILLRSSRRLDRRHPIHLSFRACIGVWFRSLQQTKKRANPPPKPYRWQDSLHHSHARCLAVHPNVAEVHANQSQVEKRLFIPAYEHVTLSFEEEEGESKFNIATFIKKKDLFIMRLEIMTLNVMT
jgi:hypothetical protein